MNLHELVVSEIKNHPSIFKNRFSVLHHYFCVNGNGLEWIDGELADRYPSESNFNPYHTDKEIFDEEVRRREFLENSKEKEWMKILTINEMLESMMEHTYKYYYKHNQEIDYIINNAEELAKDVTVRRNIYPLCRYAKIVNIPDDIDPKWLEVVFEVIKMILSAEISDRYTEKEKNHNDKYALKIKKELKERFNK